jgi:serine/threonine protein kinase
VERLADYAIVRPLGRANHGELYLAHPPARLHIDADTVVLKVLDGRADDAIFRRVTRELRAFAATRSDHRVIVYEAGQEGDHLYYSMEVCPGGTLAEPVAPLDRADVLIAVSDVARAAHDLHEAGIAHRDIRPENVLLVSGGAKLGDLGLAQLMTPDQTVTGIHQVASVEYLDPQILKGERASRATDIWSLGLTLHRALSGTGVYGHLPMHDPLLAFRKILTTTPQLSDALVAAERAIVERCVGPAHERYQTASEVADLLDDLVGR